MAGELIKVTGLEEVQKKLREAPRRLVVRSFARALSAGAGVIEQELAARTPEGDNSTSTELYGSLIDNLTSEVVIDVEGRGGTAKVGFGKKGYVALFVEYGHQMIERGATYADRKNGYKDKKLGGSVPAHPFMRPAAEAAADSAIQAFQDVLASELEKDL